MKNGHLSALLPAAVMMELPAHLGNRKQNGSVVLRMDIHAH